MSVPSHHDGRGFRNPWPDATLPELMALWRWSGERLVHRVRGTLAATPPASAFPPASPEIVRPRAAANACRVTWVGHSTCLIQVGGINVLTDPMWSTYSSPVQGIGPRRIVPPAVALEALPPIDVVLQSHNHYDHYDTDTIRALVSAHPDAAWLCPLKLGPALRALGVREAVELDWWESRDVATAGGRVRVTAAPAQHFSGRTPFDRNDTLWCAFALEAGPWRVFFGGDTGLHPEFDRIATTCGPFDVALLPVGAYAPRWFMKPVHMDPDEALAAFDAVSRGTACALVPIHWGTFRLTDEPMDEPPRRVREGWARRGLPAERLWLMQHGATRVASKP